MFTDIYGFWPRYSVNFLIYDAEIGYTIFRHAQAKFSIYAIHGLRGLFRNVTPRITDNPLCMELQH